MKNQRLKNIWCAALVGGALLWATGILLNGERLARAQLGSGVEVVLMAPAIDEAPEETAARGVFYMRVMTMTIPLTTTKIWLASSPDGQGAVCTDDQATLTFAMLRDDQHRQVHHWSHDFVSADGQQIECLPPQEMMIQVGPGQYRVEMVLEDVRPTTYHSYPYYLGLVLGEPPPMQATHPPELSRPADSHEAVMPSATPFGTAVPPTDVPQKEAPVTGWMQGGDWFPVPATNSAVLLTVAGGMALLMVAGTAVVVTRRRREEPAPVPMVGMLDLLDHDTLESCTALLSSYPQGW
ncbi:MAG: hypothetical protein HC884_06030 [Chloroflexaceae bacterium]|nr:hypothetical protein [Chloroflexaceae bacterium]